MKLKNVEDMKFILLQFRMLKSYNKITNPQEFKHITLDNEYVVYLHVNEPVYNFSSGIWSVNGKYITISNVEIDDFGFQGIEYKQDYSTAIYSIKEELNTPSSFDGIGEIVDTPKASIHNEIAIETLKNKIISEEAEIDRIDELVNNKKREIAVIEAEIESLTSKISSSHSTIYHIHEILKVLQ